MTLFNNFFSSVSVFAVRSGEYHSYVLWYICEHVSKTDTEEKKLLNNDWTTDVTWTILILFSLLYSEILEDRSMKANMYTLL